MDENLRTPKEYEEIDDQADANLVVMEARLAQVIVGLVGFGYTLTSTLEKGFYPGTILYPVLSLLLIAFAETKIRDEVQETYEMYHEPGVDD